MFNAYMVNYFTEAVNLIRKVLVAVDGSDNSNRALDFALDFSERYGAALTIINVSKSSTVTVVPPEIAAYSGDNRMGCCGKGYAKVSRRHLKQCISARKFN